PCASTTPAAAPAKPSACARWIRQVWLPRSEAIISARAPGRHATLTANGHTPSMDTDTAGKATKVAAMIGVSTTGRARAGQTTRVSASRPDIQTAVPSTIEEALAAWVTLSKPGAMATIECHTDG